MDFTERMTLLVDQQSASRASKQPQRLIKAARFKEPVTVESIDYKHPRGLKNSQIGMLLNGEWIGRHQNLVISGPTGCGKTYLA